MSVVNCTDDEVKVEFSKPDPEAGKAALGALERAIEDYREGLIDVIVTAPINKHTIQSEEFSFPGHTEYIEERLGNGNKSLMILMKNDFRVALVTTHIPVREIATTITKELIQEKLDDLSSLPEAGFRHRCSAYCGVVSQSSCRRRWFAGYGRTGSDYPCHEGNGGKGISLLRTLCCRRLYGIGQLYAFRRNIGDVPRPGDWLRSKALAMDDGVNYTAGLPVVRTSPAHGTAYDIAGKGLASEDSFRQAVYVAIDVFRNRQREKVAHANPLRKQYYEKRMIVTN